MAVTIPVKTDEHTAFVDITRQIAAEIPGGFSGGCLIFCQHTTAGLTINENADPDVVSDLQKELERLVPWDNARFRHMEGNSAAHMKSSLMGPSLTVPVEAGKLILGTWQSIYFCEFDGPRQRKVSLQFLAV
ncbi:MAG: secondary thiamine-phosphate synthase enzyme YjbQ [Lentisphaeria bacterium]